VPGTQKAASGVPRCQLGLGHPGVTRLGSYGLGEGAIGERARGTRTFGITT
jgi:hypothetical protein